MNSRGLHEWSARRRPPLLPRAACACRNVAGRGLQWAACGLTVWTIGLSPAMAKSISDVAKTGADKTATTAPEAGPPAKGAGEAGKAAAAESRFDIDEFRIEGADNLPQIEVEAAVYPFLGPNKSAQDVEKARAAVEKAYHDRGLQTVTVAVPQQDAQRGFVVLKVTENRVGRLRVKGSRYFDLSNIKENAPSLKEGTLPNFQDVTKDIVSLNRWSDRRG